MKKKLLLAGAIAAIIALPSFTIYKSVQSAEQKGNAVYVCTGPQSKRYHKTDKCRGLSSCSGTIKKVSIDEAKRMNRIPCKICY